MVIKEQNLRIIIIFKGNATNIYLSSKKSISNDYKKKRKQKISLNESISSKCKFTSNTSSIIPWFLGGYEILTGRENVFVDVISFTDKLNWLILTQVYSSSLLCYLQFDSVYHFLNLKEIAQFLC